MQNELACIYIFDHNFYICLEEIPRGWQLITLLPIILIIGIFVLSPLLTCLPCASWHKVLLKWVYYNCWLNQKTVHLPGPQFLHL